MFRTLCVRHQEDHVYVHLFMVCFSCVDARGIAGGRMCTILHVIFHILQAGIGVYLIF